MLVSCSMAARSFRKPSGCHIKRKPNTTLSFSLFYMLYIWRTKTEPTNSKNSILEKNAKNVRTSFLSIIKLPHHIVTMLEFIYALVLYIITTKPLFHPYFIETLWNVSYHVLSLYFWNIRAEFTKTEPTKSIQLTLSILIQRNAVKHLWSLLVNFCICLISEHFCI